jgi:hypothetical protein
MTNRFMSTRRPAPVIPAISADEPGEQIETAVPAIRPGLPKSREAKREPQTFVDVLAAEDVGTFPDRNMTEAFSVLVA